MKASFITMVEFLYIGILCIAMSILNLLAFICFGMATFVRHAIKAARVMKEMYHEAVRTLAVAYRYAVRILGKMYHEAVKMLTEVYRGSMRTLREARFCYKIPVAEYLEYIRMECREAWNFRNEIIEAGKA